MADDKNESLILSPRSFGETAQMSKFLAGSKIIPKDLRGEPASVAIVIATAVELQIGPMMALREVYVVNGRPQLSANLMVALVRRSGACRYFRKIHSDLEKAIYETQRADSDEPVRMSFTIEEARIAGLTGKDGPWKQYPAAMLRARAKSILAREEYPEILAGFYSYEEADDYSGGPPSRDDYEAPPRPAAAEPEVIDAEVVDDDGDAEATTPEWDQLLAAFAGGSPSNDDWEKANAYPPGSPERAELKEALEKANAS